MSVPSELMQVIAGGAGKMGGKPPIPAPGPGAEAAPNGAPMTTPQPAKGEQQAAMINISLAMDLLEKSLHPFGAESKEGEALMKAMTTLTRQFGQQRDSAKPLIPAELKQLMQTAGMKSPEMQAMGAGGMPGAGGPPGGGMPPGGPPMPMAA